MMAFQLIDSKSTETEHIVCGIYHNPAKPQFTIKRIRPQQFVDAKFLGRMILAHQVPLGAGQDILNLWFLGYTELCFFSICKESSGSVPDSHGMICWN